MTSEQAMLEMRRLSGERDAGTLTMPEYRRQRAQLLDGLAGLDTSTPDLEPTRPRGDETARIAGMGGEPPNSVVVPLQKGHASRGRRAWIAIGSFLIIAAAVLFWWFVWSDAPADHRVIQSGPPPLAFSPAKSTAPNDIADFLRQGDWSDAAISRLNNGWLRLSERDIIAALSSEPARQLAEQTQIRVRAANRNDSTGGTRLAADSPLLVLARHLNVELDSP
jgi:hypothetical protein